MHHMAVVRAWPWASITRAVTTVRRIGRRTPTLYRFKWCGANLLRQDTSLCAGPGRREHGNGQPFSELTNNSEVIDVLVDALKQSRGKADIKFLYQRRLVKAMQTQQGECNSVLSTVFDHIHENCMIYDTDTIIEMLKVLHYHGARNKDILVLLGEELASRISSMPIRVQYKAFNVLLKLNLDHLMHVSPDTHSLVDDFKLKSESTKCVAHVMQFFKQKSWSIELEESLQHYVIANSSKLSLRDICQVLSVMIEKKVATPDVLRALAKAVSSILMQHIPLEDRSLVWGGDYRISLINLFWGFGKVFFYDEELFASFASLLLGKPDFLLQRPLFFVALSWCCAKARFYSEPVMQSIAEYSLKNLTKFKCRDLALLAYSFASLNCRHHDLLKSAMDRILSDPNHSADIQTCWMTAWAAMVMEQYPVELLSHMLTDNYMRSSVKLPKFRHSAVFQLCIALNFEQPNLGLGVNFEPSSLSNWGSGFVGVGKISDKVMQLVRKDRIMWYKFASRFTPFNQRVGDALRVVVGGSQYYTAEALSISGYNMDFEILFDADHRPISIPDQWKRHSKDHLLHSIGLGHEKGGTLSPADLLETSAQMEGKTDASISTADTVGDINLASDWGQKFIIPSTPVSKKIAIEADGPWHFASNCNHVMGDTVLKHRQLKALGWEVISIPYREWRHLEIGNERVQYLLKKLNLQTIYYGS